jgi:hypothetical protein
MIGTPVGDISFALSDDVATKMEIGFKFTAFEGVTNLHLHPYDAALAADLLVGNEIYNVTGALANGALKADPITGGNLYTRYALDATTATLNKAPGLGLAEADMIAPADFMKSVSNCLSMSCEQYRYQTPFQHQLTC